jgi:hypothetical protein
MLKANITSWLLNRIVKDLENQKTENYLVAKATKNCIASLSTSRMYCDALRVKRDSFTKERLKKRIGELYGDLIEKLF